MRLVSVFLCLALVGCLDATPRDDTQPVPSAASGGFGEQLAKWIETDCPDTDMAIKVAVRAAQRDGIDVSKIDSAFGTVGANQPMTAELRREWAAKARSIK